MKSISKLFYIIIILLPFTFIGCDKSKLYDTTIPPALGTFLNNTTSIYYVTGSPTTMYQIPVGVTNVSDKNRTLTYSVTSSTATLGVQYTVAPTATVTILAGKAIDTITVKGLYSGYTPTRVDTLTFTLIPGGDVPPSNYNNTFKLILKQACTVVPSSLVGAFVRSTDIYNGANSSQPNYTATVSAFTATSATTATINIKNLGATSDNGWGPFSATDGSLNPGLTATLDWTNPGNQTIKIALQSYFGAVANPSTIVGNGTFSSCDNTYTVVCDVKYAPNGNTYRHTSLLRK